MRPSFALTLLLLAAPAAAGDELAPDHRRHAVVVADLDPALLAGPPALAAPIVLAHGNLGIPRVITWANTAGTSGIAWGTTAAITAANAYISYNATDMLINVPTGDGILFRENEVTHVSIAATGAVLLDGTDDVVQLTVQGFSTQTTLPFVVENSAGTDQFTVSNAGAVVALGTLTLTGTAALNAAVTIDGSADVVQLTVQGNATQTTLPFVVENSAGTDQFTVSNAGVVTAQGSVAGTTGVYAGAAASIELGVVANQLTIATGSTPFTVADGVMIDGSYDGVQLTVQGFSTQTTLPFVVENSAGTDQFTVSNAGAVVAAGDITSGNDIFVANGRFVQSASGTVAIDFNTIAAMDIITANTFGMRVTDGTNTLFTIADGGTVGNVTVTGTSTLNGAVAIDGAADVVQLTVQGNATQTTLPFVVENSAGTDQFTVSNAGVVTAQGSVAGTTGVYAGAAASIEIGVVANQITIATGSTPLTVADGVLIDGSYDGVQLTVQGFSTQTTLPFVVENSAGTDQFTASNTGELVALNQFGTLVAVAANGTGLGGQINIAHISGSGGSTTGAVAGTGCGTSSLPTQSGNDIGGSLGVTCGTNGTTGNAFVTITFADAYSTAPFCVIAPENAATAAGIVAGQHVPVTTTTTLAVNCGGGTCTTGTLAWRYHCSQ